MNQFFSRLISKTNNFGHLTWMGQPIWQNVLDLWTIQETIVEVRPDVLIECGTHRGGSSLFFAHLFDLMDHGNVISIDIVKLHDLRHPRVHYIIGDSLNVVEQVRHKTNGVVMVILDSNHTCDHVFNELCCYAPLVTPGSYCLVQDGVIDVLDDFQHARPGPLRAIERFLASNDEFEVDEQRSNRFLITHHPKGWLRRKYDLH